VASSVGFVFDSGDREWTNLRDRERLRRFEVAEVNKKCTTMSSSYL
jgi:frataxin-like iron-binding protein CyaY